MKKIILEFNDSLLRGKDPEHLNGLLVSFLDVLDEILLRRKPVSLLSQFYQERLDKSERKVLQLFFEKGIESLLRKAKKKSTSVHESLEPKEIIIPEEFQSILEYFQSEVVSTQAIKSRQSPKAGETTSGGGNHV